MDIVVVGAGFSAGGAHPGCRRGPASFYRLEFQRWRVRQPGAVRWGGIVTEASALPTVSVRAFADSSRRLQRRVRQARQSGRLPIVIGGDHSCAIGTWSGMEGRGGLPLGLLWIDAHMDAHTRDTSPSQRLHGMPLAVLLGEGCDELRALTGGQPAISAGHCAVIGVRSFEPGEPERLRRLGVRFYTMEEIRRRGLPVVMREAWRLVSAAPGGFGVSLDLDVLDPLLAPGVSVHARNGLQPDSLARCLRQQPRKQALRGLEMAELNPARDPKGRTRRLIPPLLDALLAKR